MEIARDLILDMKLARSGAMKERRTTRRYKISVAVVVRRLSNAMASEFVQGKTHDLSTRGLYFTSNQRFAFGTRIGLSLTLPLDATDGSRVFVDAKGKVLRVEEKPDNVSGHVGIAAVIDSYNIVRPKSAA
jgi:hypothetical protein